MENGGHAVRVKGFEKLTIADADLFKAFLVNFYHAWGLDARATIIPIKIKRETDCNGTYLRFDYKMYDKNCWLHVRGSHAWD